MSEQPKWSDLLGMDPNYTHGMDTVRFLQHGRGECEEASASGARTRRRPDVELPDLDAIEARANAATDGPWVVKHEPAWEADNVQHPDVITVGAQMWEGDDEPMTVCLVSTDYEDDPVDVLLDAEFIAHARTDVPALIALCREQAEELARLRSEVERWHNDYLATHTEKRELTSIVVKQRDAIDRVRTLPIRNYFTEDGIYRGACVDRDDLLRALDGHRDTEQEET